MVRYDILYLKQYRSKAVCRCGAIGAAGTTMNHRAAITIFGFCAFIPPPAQAASKD